MPINMPIVIKTVNDVSTLHENRPVYQVFDGKQALRLVDYLKDTLTIWTEFERYKNTFQFGS